MPSYTMNPPTQEIMHQFQISYNPCTTRTRMKAYGWNWNQGSIVTVICSMFGNTIIPTYIQITAPVVIVALKIRNLRAAEL